MDSFAGEKGKIILRSRVGCGKGDLFSLIALLSLAVLSSLALKEN